MSLNLYTYCYNNPIRNYDPTGHVTYQKGGLELAPIFVHDPGSGYIYDPKAKATADDYLSYIYWHYVSSVLYLSPWTEAAVMYGNYLSNTGKDMIINYRKAYREDKGINRAINAEVMDIKRFVNEAYRINKDDTEFEIIGEMVSIQSTSFNWAHTVGQFQSYGYGIVRIDPETGMATMNLTFALEDVFNFNTGEQQDISTGIKDSVNGRFAVLGWAKEFTVRGIMSETITWDTHKGISPWD